MRLSRSTLLTTTLGLSALAGLAYASQRTPQKPLRMSSDPQDQAPTIASSSSPLLLSDSLSAQRSLSIFSSLARDDTLSAGAFSASGSYTIVLAPINSAIKALQHRPWEDPEEASALGGEAYKGEDGVGRAESNLRRWVQGCLVKANEKGEWKEGERLKRGLEVGAQKEVWWEVNGEGKQVIMPEKIVVQGVVSRVANGEVWALEGTFGK